MRAAVMQHPKEDAALPMHRYGYGTRSGGGGGSGLPAGSTVLVVLGAGILGTIVWLGFAVHCQTMAGPPEPTGYSGHSTAHLFHNGDPARGARKRVLVTGAAGFIGFHVSHALRARGDAVVGLDNFNAYYSVQLKRDRATNLTASGVPVVEADVCDEAVLARLFEEHAFTNVVHLAAQAGVRYSIDHPHDYVRSNVDCFVTLLETLRRRPTVRLVYASSSSVYGHRAKIPFSLDDLVDHPSSLYGATKRMNELTGRVYNHLYGVHVTGLRFFTVYGPWGRPDMAPFVFTDRVSKGEAITVYGEGKMQRDFTFIDDIVDGIVRAIDYGAADEIFNVGNGHPIVLDQFIRVVETALGRKANRVFKAAHSAELAVTYADTSHTADALNYRPRVDVAEGVRRFVEWYRWYSQHGNATEFLTPQRLAAIGRPHSPAAAR